MSEALRSARYHEQRVLIETARVLDPQFSDGVLHITGAEFELLRNLVAYLHRQSTFVSEYRDVDYLTPTVSDWDNLRAVTANLEEKLMGNENIIWGYHEPLAGQVVEEDASAGSDVLVSPAVSAGEVWVVELIQAHNSITDISLIRLYVGTPTVEVTIAEGDPAGVGARVLWAGKVVLPEGANIRAFFIGTLEGDNIYLRWWGHKMRVSNG